MPSPAFIPYSRQHIDNDDIDAVTAVLKSDFLTQGPQIAAFERQVADYCGSRFAVSFSNGTTALHAACTALGLKTGDEGITTPITFAATSNSLLYTGAKPVFADVVEGIPLIDPKDIERKITPQTKVIMPVHFAGSACDMEAIHKIATDNKLFVIEDACHALGATYKDNTGKTRKVGSSTLSDMTIFSFHPVKSIATGEGGMITTNNKTLYNQLVILRQHGIWKPDPADTNYPGWYYEMRDLGFNYRLTDIQAALGISQMKKLDFFIGERRKKFEEYKKAFQGLKGVSLLIPPPHCQSAFHLGIIQLASTAHRNALYQHLKENGIGSQVHYIPVYHHPYYKNTLKIEACCPHAENYFNKCLSLPLYPNLNVSSLSKIVETIQKWSSLHA